MSAPLSRRQVEFTSQCIALAGTTRPLDQILRSEFKRQKGLTRLDSSLIASAAHAFYRWRGWLDLKVPAESQIEESLRLDAEFQASPNRLTDREILERAVPSWLAETMDISGSFARSLQSRPVLWLRARPGQAVELAGKLFHAEADPSYWKDAVRYEGQEDLFRTPSFQAGDFEIQDLNSQAVGWICAPSAGETWWDGCAGEGGKTLHLSDLMQNKGMIWATDTARWRLDWLKQRTARARVFNYRARLWSDTSRLPSKTVFDGVLIDAPCSGVGTWQRNPQARWMTQPDSIDRLAALQKDLLRVASASVKPGGKIVYSVCTLTRNETTAVADEFEASHKNFVPAETPHPWSGKNSSRHWFWPEQTGGNGMFAAVWKCQS